MMYLFLALFSASLYAKSFCYSKTCLETADRMQSWIKSSMDPCDNFYEFSWYVLLTPHLNAISGGFIESNRNSTEYTGVSSFVRTLLKNLQFVDTLLSSNTSVLRMVDGYTRQDQEAFKKVKTFYKSCLKEEDTFNQSRSNASSLTRMVSRFHSNYLFLSNHNDSKTLNATALTLALVELTRMDESFFHVKVLRGNPSLAVSNILFVPHILDRQLDFQQTSKSFPSNISNLFSQRMEMARNLSLTILSNSSIVNMTLKETQPLFRSFDLSLYLHRLFGKRYDHYLLRDQELSVSLMLEFMKRLDDILQDTPIGVLQGYLLIDYTLSLYVKKMMDIKRIGAEIPLSFRSRKNVCSAMSINYFDSILTRIYSIDTKRDLFPSELSIMVDTIKYSWKDHIRSLEWLDDSTKKAALEKLDLIAAHIHKPSKWKDAFLVSREYSKLELHEDDFYGNLVTLRHKQFSKEKQILFEKEDKSHLDLSPLTVNAFYKFSWNDILIPLGILQEPFYNRLNPVYLNYGALGFVIGHELGHAFDDQGSKLDGSGKMKNWWSQSNWNEFKNRSDCMISQYENYSQEFRNSTLLHVNGSLTLSENIADNIGLHMAYKGWQLLESMDLFESKNARLPGMNYTNPQLFFISFAQAFCKVTDYSPTGPDASIIKSDNHAPVEFRVNGVVSNSRLFSSVFRCQSRQPMNPESRCVVWKK